MSRKIEFVLELTREEAVSLVLLKKSGFDGKTIVDESIHNIGGSLLRADVSLDEEQFNLWMKIGEPTVELVERDEKK